MTVRKAVEKRNIREVMHFTTNRGLVGVLHTGRLLSRLRLPTEKYLEHICTFNCDVRKDKPWLDFVNLSLSWINPKLFDISSNFWHKGKDLWWCVLSFDSKILEDENVYFVNTNNMYTGAKQARGTAGLEALFAPAIVQYLDASGAPIHKSIIRRPPGLAPHLPTDPQAEVLYPEGLSVDALTRIYVPNEELADRVLATAHVFDASIETVVRPELFNAHADRY